MAKIKKVLKDDRKDIIDISGIVGLEAIEIDARKFSQFDLDFINDLFIPEFEDKEIEEAIVNVNIKIKQEDIHKIPIKEIEERIMEKCYILRPIVPVIQKVQKLRNIAMTVELSPLEAVKVWVEDKDYKQKDKILKLSEEIIRESDY